MTTKTIFGFIAAITLALSLSVGSAAANLPRSTPEAEGIPSSAITALFDSLMSLPDTEMHSIMVLRHGKVVAETYPTPFSPDYNHTMYSCSKTFVGAAVGLAIADNRLRLTDRVATFFPEDLPTEISPELAAMTVRDLLTMTSGIQPDWNMRNITDAWIATYLAKPVEQPGTRFQYDSICTYVLSAIVQKVTGMKLLDYLRIKLFNHMDITDARWEISPEGYNTGGWGLHIKPESLAKFGVLLSHNGVWEGKQLIPAEWVKDMTSSQMKSYPGAADYCYQTWRCEYPGAFRADGALGQYILVVPEKDVVVVITECTMIDGIRQRRLVWNLLMPAVSADGDAPLTPGNDLATLKRKSASYSLATPAGKAKSGKMPLGSTRSLSLADNRLNFSGLSLTQSRNEMSATITLSDGSTVIVPLGYRKWLSTVTPVTPPYSISPRNMFTGIDREFVVAGSYAWKSASQLSVRLQYANWVTALSLDITFDAQGNASVSAKENYSREAINIVAKKL
ncbi:MAG: serine hydrolase domain-containing protein [Muribaculaceae bacterium]